MNIFCSWIFAVVAALLGLALGWLLRNMGMGNISALYDNLQGEHADLKREFDSLKSSHSKLKKDTSGRGKDYDNLKNRLSGLEGDKSRLTGELDNYKTRFNSLQLDLDNVKSEKDSLHNQLTGIQSGQTNTEEQLKGMQEEINRLASDKASIAGEFEVYKKTVESKYTQALSDVETMKATVSSARSEKDNASRQLSKLEGDLSKSRGDTNSLRDELAELKGRLGEIDEWKSKANLAEQERDQLQREKGEASAQASAKQAAIETYEKDINDLKVRLNSAEGERDSAKSAIPAKDTRISSLEAQLQQAQAKDAEISSLRSQLQQAQSAQQAGSEWESKFRQLETDWNGKYASLNTRFNTAEGTIGDRDQTIASLRAKIAELEAKAAAPPPPPPPPAEPMTKEEATLAKVRERAANIDFGRIGIASADQKDDLKLIKGIGPFLEKKCNALGIYTFKQIANFTPEDEEKVNDAIEFFPGRIKRDEWARQAKEFVEGKS